VIVLCCQRQFFLLWWLLPTAVLFIMVVVYYSIVPIFLAVYGATARHPKNLIRTVWVSTKGHSVQTTFSTLDQIIEERYIGLFGMGRTFNRLNRGKL
jgi:hypothetical protein